MNWQQLIKSALKHIVKYGDIDKEFFVSTWGGGVTSSLQTFSSQIHTRISTLGIHNVNTIPCLPKLSFTA